MTTLLQSIVREAPILQVIVGGSTDILTTMIPNVTYRVPTKLELSSSFLGLSNSRGTYNNEMSFSKVPPTYIVLSVCSPIVIFSHDMASFPGTTTTSYCFPSFLAVSSQKA